MGWAKEQMMREQAQLQEATDVAVRAGALKRCEWHPDIVWDNFGDPAEAYKIGNAMFSAGELQTQFESRRELTDAIKAAIEQAGIGRAPSARRCSKTNLGSSGARAQTKNEALGCDLLLPPKRSHPSS